MPKFKVGDKVKKISKSLTDPAYGIIGEEYIVKEVSFGGIIIAEGGPACIAENFELVSTAERDEWSDWEECATVLDHSAYYKNCRYKTKVLTDSCTYGSSTQFCIKLTNRVSVQGLTGTVQLVGGKPDWSTYED